MRALLVVLAASCGGGSSPGPGIDGAPDPDAGPEATDCPATEPEVVDIELGFRLDDTHFYFTPTNTSIARRPITGGPDEPIADFPDVIDGGIAIGTDHVFAIAGSTAFRVAKSGGVPEPIGEVTGQVTEIATDGTALYFANVTNTDIELRRAATPDGTTTLLALATQTGAERLVADGTHLYWAPFQSGVIQRVAVTGGTPEPVADSAIETAANISNFGLALAGDELVWSATYQSFPDGRVFSIPKQGGSRRELSHTGLLTGLAVVRRDAFVMLTGASESAIAKIPLDGGPRTIIGCVPDRVLSLQANASGVYTSANGEILKLVP